MELNSKFDAKAIESEIKEYTKSIDIEKLIFASDKPEKIRFIEGPPTMNGIPHAVSYTHLTLPTICSV